MAAPLGHLRFFKQKAQILVLKKIKIISEIIVAVSLVISLILGIALWRIYQAPISIGLLTRTLENVISSDNDEILIAIDDTVVAWGGWDRLIEIRALGVKALGGDRLLTEIPVMSIGLSGLAMMSGQIAPRRIELVQPHLLVIRSENGIGFDLGGSGNGGTPVMRQITQSIFGQAKAGDSLSYLKRFSVTDAQISFEDQILGHHWLSDDSSLIFERFNDEITGAAALNIITDAHSVLVESRGSYKITEQNLSLKSRISGLRPNKIVDKLPNLEALKYLNIPFNIESGLTYDVQTENLAGDIRLGAYSGLIESVDSTLRLAIDDLDGTLTLPEDIRLDDLALTSLPDLLKKVGVDFRFSGYLEGNGRETPVSVSLDRAISAEQSYFTFDFSNFMPASYAVLLPEIQDILSSLADEEGQKQIVSSVGGEEDGTQDSQKLPALAKVASDLSEPAKVEDSRFKEIESLLVMGQFPVSGHLTGKVSRYTPDQQQDSKITSPHFGGYLIEDVKFLLEGKEGIVQLPHEINPAPIALYNIKLKGEAFQAQQFATIHQFDIDLGGGQISTHVTVKSDSDSDMLSTIIHSEIPSLPVSLLQTSWPHGMATGAQEWVVENMRSGMVQDFSMDAGLAFRNPFISNSTENKDQAGFELQKVEGQFKVLDARTGYFGKLADIEEASADIRFTDKRFDIAVKQAKIRDLKISDAMVSFIGLDQDVPNQIADIKTQISGNLSTIMQVLDADPLNYAKLLKIKPADLSAHVNGHFKARFPLLKDLKLSQLQLDVSGQAEKFAYKTEDGKYQLEDGLFHVDVTTEKLSVTGVSDVNSVPVQLALTESFDRQKDLKTNVDFNFQADEQGLAKLHIPLVGDYVSGPGKYDLKWQKFSDNSMTLAVAADLTNNKVKIDPLKWQKQSGEPGKLEADLLFDQGKLSLIKDLAFAFPDLSGKGKIAFTPDGQTISLSSADFSDVIFDRSRLSRLAYAENGGARAITVKGDFLDLSRFYDASAKAEPDKKKTGKTEKKAPKKDKKTKGLLADFEIEPQLPYSIVTNLGVKQLSFGGGEDIRSVAAKIVHDGQFWRKIDLSGLSGDKEKIRLDYVRGRTPNELVVWVDNVEKLAKSIGVLENIRAGSLAITGNHLPKEQGGSFAGRLEMRDYRLVNAPTLAKLLTVASLTGILDILATGDGLTFTKMSGQYLYKHKSLALQNLRTYSPALGITASGSMDLASNQINLTGTVAPAYLFSQVIESIPVVGRILTGSKGEGVFAATYAMDGDIEDPNISLNPLAALAPGFLRDIFGLVDQKETISPDPKR